MIFEEKKIILKDGREAILKSPEVGEGEQYLEYIKKACGETEFLLAYPEEWEGISLESEERWIESGRSSPNIMRISCYIDGKVAGNSEISFHTRIKSKHRASIGISILEEYWGLGIGSAMFEGLISTAKGHEGTEIVELQFIEGNKRARALYEKFGFRIVSVLPNAFKLKSGATVSEFYMQKKL